MHLESPRIGKFRQRPWRLSRPVSAPGRERSCFRLKTHLGFTGSGHGFITPAPIEKGFCFLCCSRRSELICWLQEGNADEFPFVWRTLCRCSQLFSRWWFGSIWLPRCVLRRGCFGVWLRAWDRLVFKRCLRLALPTRDIMSAMRWLASASLHALRFIRGRFGI